MTKMRIKQIVNRTFIKERASTRIRRRFRLYQDQKGKCAYCGMFCYFWHRDQGHPMLFTVDHVHARHNSPKGIQHEVAGACQACNHRKDHMTMEEWLAAYSRTKLRKLNKKAIMMFEQKMHLESRIAKRLNAGKEKNET